MFFARRHNARLRRSAERKGTSMANRSHQHGRTWRSVALQAMLCLAAFLPCGCRFSDATSAISTDRHAPRAVVALSGRPLPPIEIDPETRTVLAENLAQARRDYEADPADERAAIWLGRRLAYLGRYHEAIDVYTEGLREHTNSYFLLRHRGHRFITTRQFDRAIEDLTRAANLAEEMPDEVEPDGAPNRYHIPTSTIQTNIYYHLGLAYYLQGDFHEAIMTYANCLWWCRNDDMRVATLYWLHLSAKRDGDEALAASVLEQASKSMNLLENEDYYSLLKLFKGEVTESEILAAIRPGGSASGTIGEAAPEFAAKSKIRRGGGRVDSQPTLESTPGLSDTTLAYGIAMYHSLNGDTQTAEAMFQDILATGYWPAFGYIAAEAELARKGNK